MSAPVGTDRDFDYEIDATVCDFGLLMRICRIGSIPQDVSAKQGRCFEVLHGRSTPCLDCPGLRVAEAWPRTTVRRSTEKLKSFEIVTAEIIDTRSIRLSTRVISDGALASIHDAKILELAERAKLTDREREVLTYLFMGRSLEDMSTILRISVRTVKFHQANVLEKLGADSRVDLVRLLL